MRETRQSDSDRVRLMMLLTVYEIPREVCAEGAAWN